MSRATSATTGRRYGLKRVCGTWERSRSALYARRARLQRPELERWNRTLKEQAVYGRVFRNLAEVRAAVAEFVERYNQCWRLEKLAYRTPLEARQQYELRHAA